MTPHGMATENTLCFSPHECCLSKGWAGETCLLDDSPHVWGLTVSALGLLCVRLGLLHEYGVRQHRWSSSWKGVFRSAASFMPSRVAASPHFPGKREGVADPKRRQHCLICHRPYSLHPTPFRKPHPFQLCIIH